MPKLIAITKPMIALGELKECFEWQRTKNTEELHLIISYADGGMTRHYYLARKHEPNDPVKIPRRKVRPEDILVTWNFSKEPAEMAVGIKTPKDILEVVKNW